MSPESATKGTAQTVSSFQGLIWKRGCYNSATGGFELGKGISEEYFHDWYNKEVDLITFNAFFKYYSGHELAL